MNTMRHPLPASWYLRVPAELLERLFPRQPGFWGVPRRKNLLPALAGFTLGALAALVAWRLR